jgi:hypothetical protein
MQFIKNRFSLKLKTLNFLEKFILFTLLILLILKIIYIKDISLIISTFIFEASIFILIKLLFDHKNLLSRIFFFIFTILNFLLLILNIYFFQDIINRKYSLFNIDLNLVSFFFKDLLPLKLIILFILSLVLIIFLSKIVKIKIYVLQTKLNRKLNFLILILLLLLIICLCPIIFNNFSHPYINTFEDMFYYKEQSLDLYDANKLNSLLTTKHINAFNKNIVEYPEDNVKYKYILIFVGETVLEEDFNNHINNYKDSFFNNQLNNSIYFNNYYANNQDSRTAIMSMLTSIFIPYESYKGDWTNLYNNKIINKKNLVDFFNIKDYNTTFVISSIETPIVGKEYNWKHNINIKDSIEYNNFKENNICLHLLEYQHGCEDLVILPKIKKEIKNSNKLFLLQEMIFGHNKEYNIKKDIDSITYYENYILEIYSYLEQENKLDETLIIFIGDHGSKAYENMKKRNSYKVPLIFINPNLKGEIDNSFYSHLDFKDLLFNNILENYNKDINNSFIYTIGATNSSFLTVIDKERNFILYDLDKDSVLATSKYAKDISYYYNLFYSYRNYFSSLK